MDSKIVSLRQRSGMNY